MSAYPISLLQGPACIRQIAKEQWVVFSRSRVIILATDGQNNENRVPPEQAAAIAETLNIRLYTIGLVTAKLFRPFLRERLAEAIGPATRVGVLDRNLSAGSGGIFWGEVAASLQRRPDVGVQGYPVGLGGGDVTPALVESILDDLQRREDFGPGSVSEVPA